MPTPCLSLLQHKIVIKDAHVFVDPYADEDIYESPEDQAAKQKTEKLQLERERFTVCLSGPLVTCLSLSVLFLFAMGFCFSIDLRECSQSYAVCLCVLSCMQGEKGQWFSNPLQERAPVRSGVVIGKYLKK